MDNTTLYYYGTNLTVAGHYFWSLHEDRMECHGLSMFDKIPFDPYSFPKYEKGQMQEKGEVEFFRAEEITGVGINGSCIDKRWGTRSVFWINQDIDFEVMKLLVTSHKMASKIINQMPFKVKW